MQTKSDEMTPEESARLKELGRLLGKIQRLARVYIGDDATKRREFESDILNLIDEERRRR